MKKILTVLFILSVHFLPSLAQGPGCPNVNAGPDQTLACNVNCTTLNATFFQTGATTNYTVTNIPYSPPAPSSAWVNSFVNIDDKWSGVIALPFTFCYYGTAYTQLVIGANGIISFNTGYANGFCPWAYSASIPSPNLPLNAIFGAYHDIDPSVCGQIRYAISGTYPCRTFMFDFNAVCHYSCTNLKTTQRIVLYETSNAIEVYIGNKPTCNGWNSGRAVIGIQNAAGDVGLVAPGRQTGNWSASNEAWRFTPAGLPNYQLNWYSSTSPNVIGTGTSVNVCPTSTFSTYSAILTYTNCNNTTVVVSDEVGVTLTGPAQPSIFNNGPVCSGATLTLSTNVVAGATYVWSGPNGFSSNAQNPAIPGATTANSGNYTLYVVVAGCTSSTATQNITVISGATLPVWAANSPCAATTLTLNADTYPGATYVWSGPGGWTSNLEDPTRPNATTAMNGNYSLYIVVNGCTSGTTTHAVNINAIPATPNFTTNSPLCTTQDIQLNGPTVAGATYAWSGPGGWIANVEDPTRPNSTIGMSGTYSLVVVVSGCSSLVATQNVVVNGTEVPVFEMSSSICEGDSITFDANTVPGATYVWSGPGGFSSSVEDPYIFPSTAAMAGTYSLYLVSNGCTSITATNELVVNSAAAPTFTFTSPLCVGNTLTLNAPTIASAIYFWTGPGYTSSAEDTAIVNVTAANSGNYSLYTVVNECTSVVTTENIVVNPTPATPNFTSNSPVCSGNPLNFDGPTVANATYVWSGPNAFASAIEDPSLDPSTTAMTGNYNLYVVVNGCTSAIAANLVTVNQTPADPVVGSNSPVCSGNALNLTSSTIAGVNYHWTGPNAFTSAVEDPTLDPATVAMTGNYDLYVEAAGCTSNVVTAAVTVNPTPAAPVVGSNSPICEGGSLNLTANTVANGVYYWSGPNAFTSAVEDPILTPATTTMSGNYSLYIVALGCTSATSATLGAVNTKPTLNVTQVDVDCIGDADGSAHAEVVSGGTPNFQYGWNTVPPQLTQDIANLAPGNYTVGVLDGLGCSDTVTITIVTNSQQPTVQAVETDESCAGLNNGSINITVTGGSPAFTYAWDSGQITEDINSLAPGNYEFTLTDQYQCDFVSNYSIVAGGDVDVLRTVNNIQCYGETEGSIDIQASGGTPPYDITLNGNTVTSTFIDNLPAGNYTIVVTDDNGCSETVNASITSPPQIVGDSTYHQIRLGDYLSLSPTYGGGTGNLTMYWSPAYNLNCSDCPNPLAYPTHNITYYVNITDENGCTGTGIVQVDVYHDGPFIPNTFTPGQDALNEVFKVSDYGVKEFELYIFDRWGEKLYYTDNIYEGWNGRQPNGELYELGVYVWKTNIRYINGNTVSLIGHVTLLR